jgi:hypothetical protein
MNNRWLFGQKRHYASGHKIVTAAKGLEANA